MLFRLSWKVYYYIIIIVIIYHLSFVRVEYRFCMHADETVLKNVWIYAFTMEGKSCGLANTLGKQIHFGNTIIYNDIYMYI